MKPQAFAIATASIFAVSVPAIAKTAPTSPATVTVTATVNPNPPRVGDNTIDLHAVDASGSAKSGLNITASVAMTSMDMGTTHPAVKDLGSGNYRATVHFAMAGPWRVTLRLATQTGSLNFTPGAKPKWKSRALTFTAQAPLGRPRPDEAVTQVPIPTSTAPAPGAMPSMPQMNQPVQSGPGYGPNGKPGESGMVSMNMPGAGGQAREYNMPQLQEEGTYVATGREDWSVHTGFGKNAAMVNMMNEMMVGGSGMEGMKMPPMKMDFGPQNYTGDVAAATTLANPASGAAEAPGSLKIAATLSNPKTGDNALSITVADAAGAPVIGAKITASVAMTSMDMGTTHPSVIEVGGGRYKATVNFGMAGPWRVTLQVAPAQGSTPRTASFDFNAK